MARKNNLVLTIPYPVVKDQTGKEYADKARFTLGALQQTRTVSEKPAGLPTDSELPGITTRNQYDLILAAKELRDLAYPISIDPTMQVRDSADFTNMNDESGVGIDNTNVIKRGSLTGGSVGSWTYNAANDLPQTRQQASTVVYNGYLYVTGNDPDSPTSAAENIVYAKLDGNGGITGRRTNNGVPSNWSSEIDLPNTLYNGLVTYNGYIYLFGGYGGAGNPPNNKTYFAKLNPRTGNIGTWAETTGYITGRSGAGTVAVNGYMYLGRWFDQNTKLPIPRPVPILQ